MQGASAETMVMPLAIGCLGKLSGWSCGTKRSSPQNQWERLHGKRGRNAKRRKPLIKAPRRRSARQADREIAVARLRERAEPFGNALRERFSAFESPALRRCGDGHCAAAIVKIALFRICEIAAA